MAKIEDVNPANNYYFPMAKYRYLPRIFRSWIAVDQLAPKVTPRPLLQRLLSLHCARPAQP